MSEITTQNMEINHRTSYFQLKYFNLGKEPTIQSKMWACLKEIDVRKNALESLFLELEDIQDSIEMADITIKRRQMHNDILNKETCDVTLDIQEGAIKLRRALRKKLGLEKAKKSLLDRKKGLEEELNFFQVSLDFFQTIEPLKPFDDLESQTEYWNKKLSEKLNLKMLLQQPLDVDLIETTLSLPEDTPVRRQIIKQLNYVQSKLLKITEKENKQPETNDQNFKS